MKYFMLMKHKNFIKYLLSDDFILIFYAQNNKISNNILIWLYSKYNYI